MTKLEQATHVSLIALCILGGGLLLEGRFRQGPKARPRTGSEIVGRQVNLPEVSWQTAPLTAVLQLSTVCHYCADSMPFYQKLAALRNGGKSKVALVVVARDPVGTMQSYLDDKGIAVDKIVSSDSDSIGFVGTPAIFIVDPKGTVKRAFLGQLDSAHEEEVLTVVKRGAV